MQDSSVRWALLVRSVDPEELSFGDRDDTVPFPIILEVIFDSKVEKTQALVMRSGLSWKKRWRTCFTDGMGRGGKVASGVHSIDWREDLPKDYGGAELWQADIEDEGSDFEILDDEEEADRSDDEQEDYDCSIYYNYAWKQQSRQFRTTWAGAPTPMVWDRTKNQSLLVKFSDKKDFRLLRIRGHPCIEGNEEADHRVAFELHLGSRTNTI
ncbi:hypothetical protein BGX38DRAFT_1276838 [Terfezia claveryi]|nr:hypothetical protein BGX38DRAFT_1276838 [Terfezia claveryi]